MRSWATSRAPTARASSISNPVRTYGFFYRAFHAERHLYKTIQCSTETNPNIVEGGRDVFPGLADRQWLRER